MSSPELIVSKWLNSDHPLSLQGLRGKVIAIHAFQMLCPGCVLHGIPQAQRLYEICNPEHIAVLGLHTVFEHHEAMEEKSLHAFLHEFRVQFPVGIDAPSLNQSIPQTMELYKIQGTPTWLIFDREGQLKLQIFGKLEDIVLGAEIAKLVLKDQSQNINLYRRE